MIVIESVQVKNVRALGEVTFEPLPAGDGATALTGANGAGKSSILSAMLWALYGVTPDGVPVSAMRRQGTHPGEDECWVVVQFRHDNQTVVVERGLKGTKDATYVTITVDGQETSFGKVRAAEQHITNRLGLNAEGFLTAFVVRQKELDGLIKARPADRRKLIERLAGIDRMSDAVKSARDEENTISRRLDVMPGSEEAVVAAQARLDQASDLHNEHVAATETAHQQAAEATAEHTQAQQVLDELNSNLETVRRWREEVATADNQVTLAEKDHSAAQQNLAAVTAATEGFTPERLREATEKQDALQKELHEVSTATERATRAEADLAAITARHAQAAARAATAAANFTEQQTKVTQIQAQVTEFPDDLTTQAATAVNEATEAQEKVVALRTEHQRLTRALAALNDTDTACCPTCETRLPDPQALIDSLTQSVTQVKNDGIEAAAAANLAQQVATRFTAGVNELERLEAILSVEQRALADLEVAEREATSDAAELADDITPATQARDVAREQAATADAQIVTIREALAVAEENVRKLRNAQDAALHVATITEAAAQAEKALVDARSRRAALTEPDIQVTDEDLATAIGRVESTKTAADAAGATYQSANEARVSVAFEMEIAEKDLGREQAQLQAKADLLVEYEAKVAVRVALDAFRKDRIARIAPELSEAATDIVTRMTDGKFTAVDLDEEFTPVVTDQDGNQRPAAWLSGGEESAVALALRVAIGELIAGQAGGLLWLDEVLTAQDSTRRPAMMRAISELQGRQIITINHVAEATDMVDAVFEVTNTPDGSILTPVTDNTPVDENAILV